MSSASLFSSLLLSALVFKALSQTAAPSCCKIKTVVGPAGKAEMTGKYILKEKSASKPDPNCADGCIYTMGADEYCFMDVAENLAANIQCEASPSVPIGDVTTKPPIGASDPVSLPPSVTTKRPSGLVTAPPSGKISTRQPGAPSPVSGEMSTRGPSGGKGTTKSPAARGQEAAQAKAAAETKKAEAVATQTAAEDTQKKTALVETKINEVSAAASGRVKRAGDAIVPPVPTTCAAFTQMVDDMTTAIALKTKEGYKTAGAIGTALAQVVATTVNCDSSAIAALQANKDKITAAKAAIERDIIQQKINIMEATSAINAAIAIIIQASAELVASGQSALADPGTPLPAVTAPVLPSVANNPAGVTPGGQPGAASVTPGGQPGGGQPGGAPATPGGQPGVASVSPGGQPGGAPVTPGGQPGGAPMTPGGSPGRPIVTPVSTTRGPINRRQNLINHYLAKTV